MLKDLQVVVDNAFILKFNIRTLLQTPSFFFFFVHVRFFRSPTISCPPLMNELTL